MIGGSGSSTRVSVGWYSTARWLPNQSRVRSSSHSAYVISRRDRSAQTLVVRIQPGAYRGRFFCMNGSWPGRTRITDSGRPASSGRIRSATAAR